LATTTTATTATPNRTAAQLDQAVRLLGLVQVLHEVAEQLLAEADELSAYRPPAQ
jgi:hypothetical protein